MKKSLTIVLFLTIVNISYSTSIGYKYWNAPYNDDVSYDHSAVYGPTYSKQTEVNKYVSAYLLYGEYKGVDVDGDKFEQDNLHAEYLKGISGLYFDVGYGLRVVQREAQFQNSGGSESDSLGDIAPILYIGSAKSLTNFMSIYGGLTYAPFSIIIESSGEDYETGDLTSDSTHFNYEVGLSVSTSLLNANIGYRYFEYIDSDDNYHQDGITFSISKSL